MAGKVCNRCGTKNLQWNREQHEKTGKWQLEDHKNSSNDWCVISKRKVIPQKFTLIHCGLCCGHFGWCDNKDVKLNHVGFGLILSKEGGKFRTRSGEVIHLIDLLMEAKTRCTKILEERVATGQSDLTPDEIELSDTILNKPISEV